MDKPTAGAMWAARKIEVGMLKAEVHEPRYDDPHTVRMADIIDRESGLSDAVAALAKIERMCASAPDEIANIGCRWFIHVIEGMARDALDRIRGDK